MNMYHKLAVIFLLISLISGCSLEKTVIKEIISSANVVPDEKVKHKIESTHDFVVKSEERKKFAVYQARILKKHNFPEGTTLKKLFEENGYYVKFDPVELGNRGIPSGIFLATLKDLLEYIEEVEGLSVSNELTGVFVVRECYEEYYKIPKEYLQYFTPQILVSNFGKHPQSKYQLIVHASVLYVYDNKEGHDQVRKYIKSLMGVKN